MGEFAVEATRDVEASAEETWSVIADAGDYVGVVDTLVSSDIVLGYGEGMVWRCVDTNRPAGSGY